ncbi:MAG TPA: CorA family divalent cation transporter [Solirubrobacteraceae bacterium]|nr:CorA family divalent cation transporter [Solirubrobacteraceae bacterium]
MEVLTEIDDDRIRALRARDEFFWLDLIDARPEEVEALGYLLELHPAAIEDSREWSQLPKLDDYGHHVMLVFFSAEIAGGTARPLEVHIYLSGHWVVTVRRGPSRLDGLRTWLAQARPEHEDEVVYHLLDSLADGWDPAIQSIDERVDELEGAVLGHARQGQLTTIYRLKQEVGELLRRATPQHAMFPGALEVINNLEGFDRGSREWLRDVNAHLDSIASDLRRLSGDLTALTDTFFNANANRLNRLATVIAVASVFFLMWTLVTGFFGQNFGWLVENIESKRDFLLFGVGGMAAPSLILAFVLWWRRDDWW